jgi:hypothetical protein
MDEPAVKKFFTSVRELREAMASGMHLDDFDRLCLENYIALLQLSYSDWKRQCYPKESDPPSLRW